MTDKDCLGFRPLAPGEIREETFRRGVEIPRAAWMSRLDAMVSDLEAKGAAGSKPVLLDAERGIAYAPPGCTQLSFTAPAADGRRIGRPKKRWRA